MSKLKFTALLAVTLCLGLQNTYSQHSITVDLKNPGSPIQKTMYGIFFEDINYGADG